MLFSTVKIQPERPCVQEAAKLEQQDKEGSGVLKRDVEKGCSQLCTSGLPSASAQRCLRSQLVREGLEFPDKSWELVSRSSQASLE